ncbi:MAG TPA: hypothetical protein VF820_07215 [Patescibacteria group bacterium]
MAQSEHLRPTRRRADFIIDTKTDFGGRFLTSNEINRPLVNPLIAKYAIAGDSFFIGSLDRGLDTRATVPQLQEGITFLVDIDRSTALMNLVQLEIAAAHRDAYGDFTDTQTYFDYFRPENVEQALQLIHGAFSSEDQQIIRRILSRTTNQQQGLNLYDTLTLVKTHQDSWVSSAERINHMAQDYNDGKILVANCDITNNDHMRLLANYIQHPLSIIDISNIDSHINFNPAKIEALRKVFGARTTAVLPVAEHAYFVVTLNRITGPAIPNYIITIPYSNYYQRIENTFGYVLQSYQDWKHQVAQSGLPGMKSDGDVLRERITFGDLSVKMEQNIYIAQ